MKHSAAIPGQGKQNARNILPPTVQTDLWRSFPRVVENGFVIDRPEVRKRCRRENEVSEGDGGYSQRFADIHITGRGPP